MQPAPASPEYPLWTIIGPGLAALTGAYLFTADLGATGRSWIVDLHAPQSLFLSGIIAAVVAAAAGAAAGFLGRRIPIAVAVPGVVAMGLGSLAVGLCPNAVVLIVGKLLIGVGAGLAWAVSVAMALSTGASGRAVTAVLAGAGVAVAVLAPFISGVVSTTMSWRLGYFLALLPLGIAVVGSIAIAASPRPPRTN
ncbi:MAG TPA: hypothetical protein VE172_10790 [Stackebrandtia sp.]|jgi:MFS family permease|uniref:hypothetical protein n=1 Tax=Stackebrandtia sp. TaxID=2023065 RepID=UPI002D433F31|nr:hypothetical protein [Stackebrandtia sp.]HZE39287.1 hypothetical protein [Stackebrandtia sp.]